MITQWQHVATGWARDCCFPSWTEEQMSRRGNLFSKMNLISFFSGWFWYPTRGISLSFTRAYVQYATSCWLSSIVNHHSIILCFFFESQNQVITWFGGKNDETFPVIFSQHTSKKLRTKESIKRYGRRFDHEDRTWSCWVSWILLFWFEQWPRAPGKLLYRRDYTTHMGIVISH